MTRLPGVSGREVLCALQRAGFRLVRIRGSHHYLRKPGVSSLVDVPVHGNRMVPLGTLASILRQAKLTIEKFDQLLRE